MKHFVDLSRSIMTATEGCNVTRLRRSMINIPGSEIRKLDKAFSLKADSIVLDLEDGVSLDKKNEARINVVTYLEKLSSRYSERCVRINSVETEFFQKDMDSILESPYLDCISLPKVECADHVKLVESLILKSNLQRKRPLRIVASIESGLGMLNIREIANSSNLLDALIFASEDYCADIGIQRTSNAHNDELLYARSHLVNCAKAFKLQCIDMVCIDYKNMDQLKNECIHGKKIGFTGKAAIHPQQLETINSTFIPSEKEVEKAKKIIDGFNEVKAKGVGVFDLNGIVIDMPIVRGAIKVLELNKQVEIMNQND